MASPKNRHSAAPVTLAQIARQAGVHVSTVSRALGAAPEGVGALTVERIRSLARELGYRGDSAAQTLRTGHSRMIGVLVPRLTDVAMATIYDGIDETARLHGYDAVVANTHDDPEIRKGRVDSLLRRRVAGFILADSRADETLCPACEASASRMSWLCAACHGRSLLRRMTKKGDDLPLNTY